MFRSRTYNKLPINDRALFTRLAVILYYNRAEIFRRVLSRWTRCPELPTYPEREKEIEREGAFVITFPESERAPITASSAKIPIWRGRPSWITRQAAPSRLTSRNNKRARAAMVEGGAHGVYPSCSSFPSSSVSKGRNDPRRRSTRAAALLGNGTAVVSIPR